MLKPVFSALILSIVMMGMPVVLAAASSTSTTLVETDSGSTNAVSISHRLKRIERMLDNQVMLEMLQRIESLQTEVRELRGELESQAFELQSMRKRQRDLYLDTDRRLRDLELANGPKATANQVVEESNSTVVAGNVTSANAQVDTTSIDAVTGNTVASSSDPGKEKISYTDAFNYLKEGRYERAIKAFSQFLQDYPSGSYADNAQYWLGEADYVSRFYGVAIKEFETVVSQYPASPKVADARLKIGYVYYELKNWQAARDTLAALQNDYPDTSVARLAGKRLARMSEEGH